MEDGQPVLGSLYVYAPNKGAPIFFVIAFGASAVGHIWQCIHYKSWKLIGLHPVCAVVFTAGYALREYGAYGNYLYSTRNLLIYIFSQVSIYICPPLLELSNYHILGRIFYYIPSLAPLPPGRVMSTFGGVMAIVELLNALGVALAANPSSTHEKQALGSHLTIAALAIQLVAICIFIALASIFHRRYFSKRVITPLTTLYISMALIFIRCLYRMVEHTSGGTTVRLNNLDALKSLSPLKRYEWYFYVFEATLMLANSVLWNVWNPGRYLPRSQHVYLAEDGVTELEDEHAKKDDRSFMEKVGNVLTFGLLFRRKRGADTLGVQFQENAKRDDRLDSDWKKCLGLLLWRIQCNANTSDIG
ncbi:hypothetical protein B0H63DRAFT_497103 [Podospora didyma]|uniref:RTA1 domain protein n=1 Tax=Podospora didyma TaxID=330526 RepID=A0AAE0K559_9PEZI|nr:hypothetical protein B0H63DRAFT_497103 [Podospora didyma]